MWFDILLWIVLVLCYFVIEGESEECVLGGGLYSFKKSAILVKNSLLLVKCANFLAYSE